MVNNQIFKNHKINFLIIFITINLLIAILPTFGSADKSNKAYVQPEILDRLNNQSEVRVTVQLNRDDLFYPKIPIKSSSRKVADKEIMNEVSNIYSKVMPTLTSSDFRIKNRLDLIPTFYGYISKDGLNKLKNNPYVKGIYLDDKITYATSLESVQLINVRDDVWNEGYTGGGKTICAGKAE